jgi:hypothetical protein
VVGLYIGVPPFKGVYILLAEEIQSSYLSINILILSSSEISGSDIMQSQFP